MIVHVRRTVQLALPGIFGLALSACAPPIYFAKATHGTVIDAETKRPIAGAVIVATWDLYAQQLTHGVWSMQITEVVSDENGTYVVPGWGPRLRPCGMELDNRDPYLMVFKSTYEPTGLLRDRDRNRDRYSWVRLSDWNDRAIELRPFRGTPETRLEQFQDLLLHVHRGPPLRALRGELMKERETLEREVGGYKVRGVFVEADGLREERAGR